ncbi:ADAPTOR COMPLEX SUBUNIT BETA FAMILY MEMBER [Salix viminalis]|uniref:ADAPTOR COMPLEX SUBUNIT BETA FAMILY MEMBER n=1 Tax=Salix viminalis TaxID=40686 RepID=A0A9Q0QAF7_SALVM|nr:ADAPTOR COMPLEX SUBUNIT BETA FAMILY MEMBER [Salix viminalis]
MIQVVLNNATVETDNPDLRDRAYIYWRLLSTDPEAAKDIVLAEKPATAQKTEDDEYAEGSEAGYPESSAQFCCLWFCFRICPAGPPSSLLQVAVKNNQQPVWYFNDKISLHVFFTEDGRMERGSFLEIWNLTATGIVKWIVESVYNSSTTADCLA